MKGRIKQQKMEKLNITVNSSRCAGCLTCQLRCSFTYTGSFNLEDAAIVITEVSPGVRSIQFTERCVKNCSLCARYCTYGAIMPEKEGAD